MQALIQTLIDNGALVSVLLLLGYAPMTTTVVILWKALQSCQEGRLAEQKESTPALERSNMTNVAMAAAIESRNRVTEGMDRSVARMADNIERLERTVEDLGRRQ